MSVVKLKFVYEETKQEIEVEAQCGVSIMFVAQKNGIREVIGGCSGSLACAGCHVVIDQEHYDVLENKTPKSEQEEVMLDFAFNVQKCSRLGCQVIVDEHLNGAIITIPKKY